MQLQLYVLNRTHIAEDRSTGLIVYADSPQAAETKLQALVAEYWEKKKVVVPITNSDESQSKHKPNK